MFAVRRRLVRDHTSRTSSRSGDEVLFARDVAEHAAPNHPIIAAPIADRDVVYRRHGDDGPRCRTRLLTQLLFERTLLRLMHGMSRPFDHYLDVLLPGALRQFANTVSSGELRPCRSHRIEREDPSQRRVTSYSRRCQQRS